MSAQDVKENSEEKKSSETTENQSFPSKPGTVLTDLSPDCSAELSKLISSVSPATEKKQKQKTRSGESLRKRVRALLEDDRIRLISRQIEQEVSTLLEDDNFVFATEAGVLARMSPAKLRAFIELVIEIQNNTTSSYLSAVEDEAMAD
jgi:hypothetical protein